jgi:hypothetical protein
MFSHLLTATDKHHEDVEAAPKNFSPGSSRKFPPSPSAFSLTSNSIEGTNHTIALGCAVRLPRSPPPCHSLSCLSSPALQQGTATSLWQQSWTRGRRRRRQTKHPSRRTYVERLSFPVCSLSPPPSNVATPCRRACQLASPAGILLSCWHGFWQ